MTTKPATKEKQRVTILFTEVVEALQASRAKAAPLARTFLVFFERSPEGAGAEMQRVYHFVTGVALTAYEHELKQPVEEWNELPHVYHAMTDREIRLLARQWCEGNLSASGFYGPHSMAVDIEWDKESTWERIVEDFVSDFNRLQERYRVYLHSPEAMTVCEHEGDMTYEIWRNVDTHNYEV